MIVLNILRLISLSSCVFLSLHSVPWVTVSKVICCQFLMLYLILWDFASVLHTPLTSLLLWLLSLCLCLQSAAAETVHSLEQMKHLWSPS